MRRLRRRLTYHCLRTRGSGVGGSLRCRSRRGGREVAAPFQSGWADDKTGRGAGIGRNRKVDSHLVEDAFSAAELESGDAGHGVGGVGRIGGVGTRVGRACRKRYGAKFRSVGRVTGEEGGDRWWGDVAPKSFAEGRLLVLASKKKGAGAGATTPSQMVYTTLPVAVCKQVLELRACGARTDGIFLV